MFIFLSKLLPLLVYPLGLTCLLLALALIWLWKSPRRSLVAIATALLILFGSSNPLVAATLVKTLEWRYLPPDPMPTADAIVALGGSTYPQSPPRPWVEVTDAGDRVLYGVKLYQEGAAPLIVFSGGRIDWQGGGPPEADDMTQIARVMGVPEGDILQENEYLNTYQNALYTAKILQQRQLNTVLLVTSANHMPRAAAIFQKLGINITPVPTDYWVSEDQLATDNRTWQGSLIRALPDAEAMFRLTRALKEYIGFAVYRLRGWV